MSEAPLSLVGADVIAEMMSVARKTPFGCFVEVGVYKGGTAYHLGKLADELRRPLYLYDTFTGIPHREADDPHKVGDFSDTSIEAVRQAAPNAIICPGVFPDTLVKMPYISFAHIDCDQYESVKACCRHLCPLMADGGIMWFDDYGCLPGATRAVDEFFEGTHVNRQVRCGKLTVRL